MRSVDADSVKRVRPGGRLGPRAIALNPTERTNSDPRSRGTQVERALDVIGEIGCQIGEREVNRAVGQVDILNARRRVDDGRPDAVSSVIKPGPDRPDNAVVGRDARVIPQKAARYERRLADPDIGKGLTAISRRCHVHVGAVIQVVAPVIEYEVESSITLVDGHPRKELVAAGRVVVYALAW